MRQITFRGGEAVSVATLSGMGIGLDGLDLEVWDRQRFHGMRPQTSAGLDSNGSPVAVVGHVVPNPAGSSAPGDPFVHHRAAQSDDARAAAIPRRRHASPRAFGRGSGGR